MLGNNPATKVLVAKGDSSIGQTYRLFARKNDALRDTYRKVAQAMKEAGTGWSSALWADR
jgi:hypothetical protein